MALAALGWALWQVGGGLMERAGLFYLDLLEGLAGLLGAI